MAYLLHHLLAESAARFPDKVAVVYRDTCITYAELDAESTLLAAGLAALGVGRAARVGIYLDRSIASITALFGVLKAGGAYVPIDPTCPPSRLTYIINTCAIACLITASGKLTNLEEPDRGASSLETVLVIDGVDPGQRSPALPVVVAWDDFRARVRDEGTAVGAGARCEGVDLDLAYVLFTSGSTGVPKGVMLTHRNALAFVEAANAFFEVGPQDRFSHVCPLHFDMSVFDLFVAFKAGATVVIIPERSMPFPVKLAEAIAGNGITVWNSVPSALSLLATYRGLGNHDLGSLRLVVFAGEVFSIKHLRLLRAVMPRARFCNMYGQTEANSSTGYWVDRLPGDLHAVLPIGKPLPNFDVFALDEAGRRITVPGQIGELFVRASTVAQGYWGDRARTEAAFVKNPLAPDASDRVYRTGDLVHLDNDGNFVFAGRRDQMIKSRGYRIELGEIETVLRNHPAIVEAVVMPVPDDLVGNRLSAVVVLTHAGALGRNDLLAYCSAHLPKYMVPETVVFRDSLPTTSSGKVDRNEFALQVTAASPPPRPEPVSPLSPAHSAGSHDGEADS